MLRVHKEENLLGLSVFDPANSTIIYIITTDNAEKKTLHSYIHQMPARKMKNSQSEHLTWFVNRKGQMNLELTFVVLGRAHEETCFTEEPIAGKASKFPKSITKIILVLVSKTEKKYKTE